jgi:hypothetical protein
MPPAASFTGSSVSIPAEPRKSPTNTPDEALFLTISSKSSGVYQSPLVSLQLARQANTGTWEKVGYTCVLPLKYSGYVSYRRGELSDYKFNERHISSLGNHHSPRYLCIQAFALSTHVRRVHAKALLEGLAYHVSLHVPNILIKRPILIAEGATRSGRLLLERFGFTMIGQSANRVPLYELDTRQFEMMPELSRDTVILLDAMVRQFSSLAKAIGGAWRAS